MTENAKPYVPLHTHTCYSILDGLSSPNQLVQKCREHGMPACAITDHAGLFGFMPFALAAQDNIKPIFGCELDVSPTTTDDRSATGSHEAAEHLVVYARNETGYRNLCKLVSKAHLYGWHYKPRVDDHLLAAHSEGLMASSACLSGRIPSRLLANRPEEARRAAARYAEIFGRERFFIELMNHGMDEEEQIIGQLYQIARELNLLPIATNDSHYTNREDARTHDILLCSQTKKTLNDESRMRLPTDQFYLRTPAEMWSWFRRWPDAVENTLAVAEQATFVMPKDQRLIPNYEVPDGKDHFVYLRELAQEGLRWRMGSHPPREYQERLDYELGVIHQMAFVDYFLVVWDMIHFARRNRIAVGPGRGSGAGSLVAYSLGITNVDPIRYGLYFERFLNPERKSMPDIDTDFCYRRREEVISYLRQRYGEMNVAQISTFQTMKANNAFRSVARAMGIPMSETNELLRLLPAPGGRKPYESLEQAREADPAALEEAFRANPVFAEVFNEARKLEGAISAVSTHAAGVVICDHDLTDHVALYRSASSELSSTQVQMEMQGVDKFGLLKIDVLGLRTLTVIWDTVDLVRRNRGIDIDLDSIDYNDEATYHLIRTGDVKGVFQLESAGMRDTARRVGVQNIEELCAVIALYRPGPMAFIDKYIESKFHPEKVVYDPPQTEPILRETYGVAIYQEQVLGLVRTCAGFTTGKADNIRRAMSKKKVEELASYKAEFIEGCRRNGIGEAKAEDLWMRIQAFAGYGFNKSHSLAYAIVAFQTAYLKAHYPQEFMCALLNSEIGKQEKLAEYVQDVRNRDIDLLPPDVNASGVGFTIENGKIRYALEAIRDVGEKPAAAIVAEREQNGPYQDIFDFCVRLADARLNKTLLTNLNYAGAFLSTGWSIHEVDLMIDLALREGQVRQKERSSGQTLLFGDTGDAGHARPHVQEYPEMDLCEKEKQVIGFYLNRHPLRRYWETAVVFTSVSETELPELKNGEKCSLAGVIVNIRVIRTRNSDEMAFVVFETPRGSLEATVFSDVLNQHRNLLRKEMLVAGLGHVNERNDRISIILDDLVHMEDAEARLTRALHIRLSPDMLEASFLTRLQDILSRAPGTLDVFLHCPDPTGRNSEMIIHPVSRYCVRRDAGLLAELRAMVGPRSAWWSPAAGLPRWNPGNGSTQGGRRRNQQDGKWSRTY
mgnify:CR=1 FL=1